MKILVVNPNTTASMTEKIAAAACAVAADGTEIIAATALDGPASIEGHYDEAYCVPPLLEAVARELFGRCLLVSVGGIESAAEVYRRLRHGASLVQLYTALAYRGPRLPGALNASLLRLLERDGVRTLRDVVGADL